MTVRCLTISAGTVHDICIYCIYIYIYLYLNKLIYTCTYIYICTHARVTIRSTGMCLLFLHPIYFKHAACLMEDSEQQGDSIELRHCRHIDDIDIET